jgi:hypothetical protein
MSNGFGFGFDIIFGTGDRRGFRPRLGPFGRGPIGRGGRRRRRPPQPRPPPIERMPPGGPVPRPDRPPREPPQLPDTPVVPDLLPRFGVSGPFLPPQETAFKLGDLLGGRNVPFVPGLLGQPLGLLPGAGPVAAEIVRAAAIRLSQRVLQRLIPIELFRRLFPVEFPIEIEPIPELFPVKIPEIPRRIPEIPLETIPERRVAPPAEVPARPARPARTLPAPLEIPTTRPLELPPATLPPVPAPTAPAIPRRVTFPLRIPPQIAPFLPLLPGLAPLIGQPSISPLRGLPLAPSLPFPAPPIPAPPVPFAPVPGLATPARRPPTRAREEECVEVPRRRRRKNKCREGFFEEMPNRTRFTTWRTVDCVTGREIRGR